MAGEAVLSALMQVVFEKVITAAHSELSLVWGADRELNKLSTTLLTIRAVLEDAEEKQIKDPAVRSWLRNLKDVAYDADDLLDGLAARALQSRVDSQLPLGTEKQVCCAFTSCSNLSSLLRRGKVAHKIKGIRERLDEISKERESLRLREMGETTRLEILRRTPTSSLVDELNVFGREEDRKKIVAMLLSEGSSSAQMSVSVLAIVGMGGLGKTTLAQLVYNDTRVEQHFDIKMWISVSQNYNISRLTKAIIEAATREKFKLTELNLLQESLKETLRGKRFLLVLDDVWNENHEEWDRMSLPLAVGGSGSKVVITTRSRKVAEFMGTMPAYCLEGLSDDECWELFCKFAFGKGEVPTNPRMEAIGKRMVRKLKGLPLAAKTLGSLLCSKEDETEWETILQSDIWELAQHKNDILPALRLSYQNLPPHLKQCFSYCSVFPKGYEFDKDKLIKVWMAQGFIQPQGRKKIEDIGAEYFDYMLHRSFFQPTKDSYLMHDMIHSLAQSVSVDECFIIQDDKPPKIPHRVRHLSSSSNNLKPITFEAFYEFRSLRTLVVLHGFNSHTVHIPRNLFLELRYLRVLDFSSSFIRELPDTIGELKHLRYLDLSATSIERLPESIATLYNLQTLKLRECFSLNELPSGMTNLISLRHLEADTRLISEIAGIGRLTSLQELPEFMVRNEIGHGISELKDMMDLRGQLCIWNLQNVASGEEAKEAKLNYKQHIRILDLEWAADITANVRDGLAEEVLEGFEPHPYLKELNIDSYNGVKFPSWVGNPLFTSLVKIYLSYCRKCDLLPPLGQLRSLKYLTIQGMPGVKLVRSEFCGYGLVKGFPSLEVLQFEDMSEWREWSGIEASQFPCLRELYIKDCPRLRGLPNLPPTLTKLEISTAGLHTLPRIWGCEQMRVSSTSSPSASTSASTSDSLSSSLPSSAITNLYIFNCPNLKSIREGLFNYHLRDLEDLTIWHCEELLSFPDGGFRHLTSLKNFVIEDCPKLRSSPDGGGLPSSLISLRINSCLALDKSIFSGDNLTSLSSLHISCCPSLTSLPTNLTRLETLEIYQCQELMVSPEEEGLRPLVSLKQLEIEDCSKLTSSMAVEGYGLPLSVQILRISSCTDLNNWLFEGIEGLASLTHLHISECTNLKSLPEGLHNLPSLQILHVHNCPQIIALPEHGLPASLQRLSIRACPMLSERCRNERGLDWHMIAYIPSISVDGRQL